MEAASATRLSLRVLRAPAPPPVVLLLAAACVALVIGSLVSDQFAEQTVAGLATGGIFGSLALALVLIYRATEVINFAQGQMAMFTTYIAWQLMQWGISYWGAFVLTLGIAFAGGVAMLAFALGAVFLRDWTFERVGIKQAGGGVIAVVIVTIGMLILLEGAAAWIWSPEIKSFPSAFPTRPIRVGGVAFSIQDLGTIGVALGSVVVLWVFFQFTKVGLAMRAAALRPFAARLVGVRVNAMLALGWGLAAVLGAIAGLMIAPTIFLQPTMMDTILIYAFAAAVLGGIESPAGAVVGGLALGVVLNLLGTYVHFVTSELRLPVALGMLLIVLLIKPTGLFGHRVVRKV
jgi:branched-chain amino acid transport system permease protein